MNQNQQKIPVKVMVGEPGEEDMGFYPSPSIYAPPSSLEEMYSLLYKTTTSIPTWSFLLASGCNRLPVCVLTFKREKDMGCAVIATPILPTGLFNCAMFAVENQGKVFSVLFRVAPRKIQGVFEEKVHNVATQIPAALAAAAGTVIVIATGASVLYASKIGGEVNPISVAATALGGMANIGVGTKMYLLGRQRIEKRVDIINRMSRGYESVCNVFGWVDESDEFFCVYGLRIRRKKPTEMHLGWGCVTLPVNSSSTPPHFFVSGNMGKNTVRSLSVFSRLSGAKITALDLRLGNAYEICGEEIKESQRNPVADFDRFWFVDIGEENDYSHSPPTLVDGTAPDSFPPKARDVTPQAKREV